MVLNGIDFDQDWEGERGEGVDQNMAAIYMYGKFKVQGHQFHAKFIPRYIYILIIYSEVAMFVSFCLNIHKLSTRLKSGEASSPPSQTGLNWSWA